MERLLADAEKLSGQKFDISSYADIVEAIHVVQNEMGITGTTAKEASETISGSLASMKSAWKNVLVAMGNDGADFNKVISQLVNSGMTFFENIIPRIKIVFQAIPVLVNQLATQIPAIVEAILPSLIEGAMGLLNGLVAGLPALMGILMEMLPTLINGILQLIVALVSNLSAIIEPIIKALPNIITMLITGLLNNLPALIQGIIQLVLMLVQATPDIILALIENIPVIVTSLIQAIIEAFPMLLDAVVELVKSIPENVKSIWNGLKDIASDAFNAVKDKASEIWNKVKTAITDPIEKARDKVKSLIDKIRNFFKFDWSLPKLKMPHLKITGEFNLMPPKVPKFSIDWYKKAMDEPMMFTQPTLFDVNPFTGSAKGAGEAGDEVMIGKNTMLNMIKDAVAEENTSVLNDIRIALKSILDLLGEYVPDMANRQLVLDTGSVVGGLAPAMDNALGSLYKKQRRGV